MSRVETCEAVVLKSYNIGEADKLCILLSSKHGRIAVCAKGVRKLGSKWGSSVQSFQHLKVDLAEHSSGFYLRSASCISSFQNIRADLKKFSLASKAAELLLHFLHDTEPSEEIFNLTKECFTLCDSDIDFLRTSEKRSCHQKGSADSVICADRAGKRTRTTPFANINSLLFPAFQISLLRALGLLPDYSEHDSFGEVLRSFLSSTDSIESRMQMQLSDSERRDLLQLCSELLKDNLSFPLKSISAAPALVSHVAE